MNNKAIICKNLTKKFGDFKAVDHISFDVEAGRNFWFPWCKRCRKNNRHAYVMRTFIPYVPVAQRWQALMYSGNRKKLKPALVI